MILVIDNYDSFTYNLVQYLGEMGAEMVVQRNDKLTVDEAKAMHPSHVIVSPGPGTPQDGGISLALIEALYESTPILGVCLGHQCIGTAFGGTVEAAPRLMHGKTSPIHHQGRPLFDGVPTPFNAMRYHSLIVRDPVPDCLEVTARTAEGEIMAVQHRTAPVVGVQFHPESILTEHGKTILSNFLAHYAGTRRDR